MEISKETSNNPKHRHGCVTAWLILMIIANSITALSYLFASDTIAQNFPYGISTSTLTLLAFIGIGNVIFAFLLFKWIKIGFWGLLITTLATFVININVSIDLFQSVAGLLGVVILYALLKLKNNDSSTWENLD